MRSGRPVTSDLIRPVYSEDRAPYHSTEEVAMKRIVVAVAAAVVAVVLAGDAA